MYIRSTSQGKKHISPPPEIIELSLMERFHWTPKQIDEIPLKTLQRLFTVMNQREASEEDAQRQLLKKHAEKHNNNRR